MKPLGWRPLCGRRYCGGEVGAAAGAVASSGILCALLGCLSGGGISTSDISEHRWRRTTIELNLSKLPPAFVLNPIV